MLTNQTWVIATFKKPLQWLRGDDEVWLLNPGRRYVLNENQLEKLKEHVDTLSELKGSSKLKPLSASSQLNHASILVERYRDRGIGDLLFMTGPLSYIYNLSGGTAKIHFYALASRASVLNHHPALGHGPLVGPTHYDDLPNYNFHWFVDQATEHCQERDQLNVYDALYSQLGLNPEDVPDEYKRPSLRLVSTDAEDLSSVQADVYRRYSLDIRATPYYVVSPTAVSNLRTAPYQLWLDVIAELSKRRPVVVVGKILEGQVPAADMAFGEFNARLNELAKQRKPVVNLMGNPPFRSIAALIQRARVMLSLDSGLLYTAQALRVPTVSLWGTHDPKVRLGYDASYMRLAIWETKHCPHAPCSAYAGWPTGKCPGKDLQRVCAPLAGIEAATVLQKVEEAEKWA